MRRGDVWANPDGTGRAVNRCDHTAAPDSGNRHFQANEASSALQSDPQVRIPAGRPHEQNGCEQNVSAEGIEEASKP
jgi:hypothetical protein